MNSILDIEELRNKLPTLTREEKLEILCKIGIALRRNIDADIKRCGKVKMSSYMCGASVIDDYDEIFNILKKVD